MMKISLFLLLLFSCEGYAYAGCNLFLPGARAKDLSKTNATILGEKHYRLSALKNADFVVENLSHETVLAARVVSAANGAGLQLFSGVKLTETQKTFVDLVVEALQDCGYLNLSLNGGTAFGGEGGMQGLPSEAHQDESLN